jgi:hypothetical protein
MKRRSKADDEPTKARRRRTAALKRRNGPKAHRRSSSIASLETKVARLTRERDEALEQQTATSEVLRAISSTPADLQPVFEAMLAHAVRICDAMGGGICRWDGDALHHVAVRFLFRLAVAPKAVQYCPSGSGMFGDNFTATPFSVVEFSYAKSLCRGHLSLNI